METNTFATTFYAHTRAEHAYAYLRHLPNLDEWTLGSRMLTRIDDDTFMGTASGYQTMLCYHVRPLENPKFPRDRVAMRLPLSRVLQAVPGVRVPFALCRPAQ